MKYDTTKAMYHKTRLQKSKHVAVGKTAKVWCVDGINLQLVARRMKIKAATLTKSEIASLS